MTEKTELKPCPCCGGEAEIETDRSHPATAGKYYIFCVDCGLQTALSFHLDIVERAWNDRVEHDTREQ